jgi:branched-chain amino acid transport system substrate-binding protein
MRFRKSRRGVILVLVLGLALCLWASGDARAEDVYTIGVLQPFSGVYAIYGEEAYAGCQVAADQLNSAGGILGRKVVLVKKDDKSDVATGVRQANDMILRDKVDAIVGPVSSAVLLGILEVTKEHKTIHLSACGCTEKATLERIHPHYFQVVPNTYMESEAIAKYLEKLDFKTYVTIALDYEWPQSTVALLKRELAKTKPDVKQIGEFWPPLKETNFASYITATLNLKPDVVVGLLAGSAYHAFIRQASGYKFFDKLTFVTVGFEGDVMAMGKEMPEGLRMYTRGPFYAIDTPKMKQVIDAYSKITKQYPTCMAILSYDSVMALADAIKKAGRFDRDAIAKALETTEFDTLRGKLSFRPIDHQMNSPGYFVTSYFDKEKGFSVGKDVVRIPGESLFRTVDEVKELREKAGIKFVPWSQK